MGRVGPESILSRFWVGRSENVDPKPPETAQNRLKPPKNSRSDPKFLRRAPRSGSVGRDRPTQNHSKWRPLGRSVGYADYTFYFASPNQDGRNATPRLARSACALARPLRARSLGSAPFCIFLHLSHRAQLSHTTCIAPHPACALPALPHLRALRC